MKERIRWILCGFLGLFFLYAGASKLWDIAVFTQAVEQYRLVSGFLAWVLALWIPWVECVAGVAIWVNRVRHGSLWILAGLLIVFEGVLFTALIRDLDISCGCFGSGSDSSLLFAAVRNLFLLAAIGWLIIQQRHSR